MAKSSIEEMVKKVVEEALDNIYMGKTLREWIDTVKQTRWIPCSEQEPKELDSYLVTWTYKDNITRFVDITEYDPHHNEWYKINNNTKIVAWMPLPKPYEEAEE